MKNARYLTLAAAVLILDQVTKYAITHGPVSQRPVEIVPGFFSLTFGENSGALFGMFSGTRGPLRVVLLLLVPIAAIVLVLFFLRTTGAQDRRGGGGSARGLDRHRAVGPA